MAPIWSLRAAASGEGTIGYAKSSDGIRAVQEALRKLGYDGGLESTPGAFYRDTQGSLLLFQKASAIPASGVIDAATLAALEARLAAGGKQRDDLFDVVRLGKIGHRMHQQRLEILLHALLGVKAHRVGRAGLGKLEGVGIVSQVIFGLADPFADDLHDLVRVGHRGLSPLDRPGARSYPGSPCARRSLPPS
jgi:hypothetical protein